MVLGASFTSWPNGSIDWVGTFVCASPYCGQPMPIITAAIVRNGARRQRTIEASLNPGTRPQAPLEASRGNQSIARDAELAVPEMHASFRALHVGIAWRLWPMLRFCPYKAA